MARPRKHYSGRKCKFESLEGRQMLAGTVTAELFKGSLAIKGDRFDNGIAITVGIIPNQVVVTGVNAGGSPTVMNGISNGASVINGFTGNLKLKTGAGNDIVTITGITVKGNAKVQAGKGNDVVAITGTAFNGNVKVKTSSGADMLTVANTTIKGATKLKTNGGNDMVSITTSAIQKLKVKQGSGNDTLNIANTTVGKTKLNGGSGVNTLTLGNNNLLFNAKQKGYGPI